MLSKKTSPVGIDTPFLIAHTIIEHPDHQRAVNCCTRLLDDNQNFALCPTVIDEFLHVATDPKRFEAPLKMTKAVQLAKSWINSRETLLYWATEASQRKQLDWMIEYRLGRKRINDTRIASIYYTHGVTRLLTANIRDYSTFGVFEIISMDG
jgi:predicted nucleic acid-binding protein